MGNPRSLRLDDSLVKKIEKSALDNGTSFNKRVVGILEEYFAYTQETQVSIEEYRFYPIHLTNEELIMIMDDFLSYVNDNSNCQVKVRKDSGGKGLDFQINYYKEYKSQTIKNVRYTFSINANWKLDNAYKHWVSDKDGGKQDLFKRLNELKIYIIDNIIDENIKFNNTPELNSNFKDDGWKVLFERKYPILKIS
jgi:hypothetical protein